MIEPERAFRVRAEPSASNAKSLVALARAESEANHSIRSRDPLSLKINLLAPRLPTSPRLQHALTATSL
jgi:hypothetical protein